MNRPFLKTQSKDRPEIPESLLRFGRMLSDRRREAGLSRAALALRAGISTSTLKNLEAGRHRPTQTTISYLCAIPELKLSVNDLPSAYQKSESEADLGPPLNCWLSPGFDPIAMVHELTTRLAGRGGSVEQSFLYLDSKSAAGWFAIANQPDYATAQESIPLTQAAAKIRETIGGAGLDVIGLGCGDARKEVRLARLMLQELEPSLISLYLLDISQPLLGHAFKHAVESLAGSGGVSVFAIQGNFHHLPSYTQLLYTPQRAHRRRLLCMFGGTFGNLENEVRFVRNNLVGLAQGDMLLLNISQAYGPPSRPVEILQKDPQLSGRLPKELQKLEFEWLTGPIERYSRPVGTPVPEMEVAAVFDTASCSVPGSYAVEKVVTVRSPGGESRRFTVVYLKRYEPGALSECMRGLGWEPIEMWHHQTGHDMLCLFRFRG